MTNSTPDDRRARRAGRLIVIASAIVVLGATTGCRSRGYFAVTVPESGHVYFTRKINRKPGGAIRFTDKETGAKVRLMQYEIERVDRHTYSAGIRDAGQ